LEGGGIPAEANNSIKGPPRSEKKQRKGGQKTILILLTTRIKKNSNNGGRLGRAPEKETTKIKSNKEGL